MILQRTKTPQFSWALVLMVWAFPALAQESLQQPPIIVQPPSSSQMSSQIHFDDVQNAWRAGPPGPSGTAGPPGPAAQPQQAISGEDKKLISMLLKNSKCRYVQNPGATTESFPSVIKIPSPGCQSPSPGHSAICMGTIYCENKAQSYFMEGAYCWANRSGECPQASDCVQQNYFDSLQSGPAAGPSSPTLRQKPREGYLVQ